MSQFSHRSRKALGTLLIALNLVCAARAANTADAIKINASSDLSNASNYASTPSSSSDVEFAAGPYNVTTYTVAGTGGSTRTFGTLNDLDITQAITISNTSSSAANLNLSTASNSVSGTAADLLFVKTGGNLTIQNGLNGGLTLNLTATGNIDNAGTLTLGSPIVITSGKTITFTGAGASTVGGAISQTLPATAASIVINDAGGSVAFDAANTYTGATTINAGASLLLDFSAGVTTSNIINSGNALNLSGGTLSVEGASGATTSQTLGAVTLTAGTDSEILLNNNGGASTALTLGAVTQNTGSLLNFNIVNGGAIASTSGATGVLGYATVTDSTGTGLALYQGSNLVKLTGQFQLDSIATNDSPSGNYVEAPQSASTSADPDLTLSGSIAINSLTIDSTAATGANFMDLGGNTVTINSGGLLSLGAQNFTVQNGVITAATTSVPNQDLYVHTEGGGTLAINATISGGATSGLDKDGAGTLILGGSNTYTGQTNIYAGVLDLASSTALDAGTTTSSELNLATGTSLVFDASVTSNAFTIGTLEGSGDIALQNNAATPAAVALTVDETANSTYSGVFSGAGSLVKTGTGTLTLKGPNTFTGGTYLEAGTLSNIGNPGGAGFGGPTSSIYVGATSGSDNATLIADNTGAGETIFIVAGTTGQLTVDSSNNQTINGAIELGYDLATGELDGSQNVILGNGGGGVSNFSATSTISGTGNVEFYVGSNSNTASIVDAGSIDNVGTVTNDVPTGSTAASGTISSSVKLTGAIQSNVTGVTQNSTVPLILSGANSFSGPVTITSGTLQANSATALGGATVNSVASSPNAVVFNPTNGTTATLALDATAAGGTTTQAASLSDVDSAGTSTVVLGTTVANTLSIGTTEDVTTNFGGVISDPTTAGLHGNIIKTGTSTQSFSGANTYTGTTTINGGTLAANNTTGSATGTGAVTVNSGAFGGGNGAVNVGGALAGVLQTYGKGVHIATYQNYAINTVGIITGPLTIAGGASLTPGNGGQVGTLTTSGLTLNSGALLTYEFNSSSFSNSFTDVTGSGDLTINGGILTLDQNGSVFSTPGVYNIFEYTGTIGGTGYTALTVAASSQIAGDTYTFVNDTTDGLIQLDITSTATPEPSTWALLFGGLGLLFLAIRRRREV